MHFAQLLRQAGPLALFLLTLLETVGVSVPSEMTLLAAGYLAASGHLSLPGAVLAALSGCLVGSSISYRVGRVAGTGWIYRAAAYLRIRQEQVARTEAWFQERGQVAVLLGRFLPFVRALVGYPAGMAGMPFGRYLAYTLVGYGAWATGSLLAGYLAGHAVGLRALRAYRHLWEEAALAAAAAAVAVWLLRRWLRARASQRQAQGTPPCPPDP